MPAVDATTKLTPDEVMRSAHRQLELALADELIQRIRSGNLAFFESLMARLLVGMGYGGSVTEVNTALVGGTGDGGIEGNKGVVCYRFLSEAVPFALYSDDRSHLQNQISWRERGGAKTK